MRTQRTPPASVNGPRIGGLLVGAAVIMSSQIGHRCLSECLVEPPFDASVSSSSCVARE